jgi:hypothetical protein
MGLMKWYLLLHFTAPAPDPGDLVYHPIQEYGAQATLEKRVEMPDEKMCLTTKKALEGTPISAECLGETRE